MGVATYPRDHYFEIHQPGDLFLAKLNALVFEIGELDSTGDVSVIEVAKRLRDALDIERVTKKYYDEFRAQTPRLYRPDRRNSEGARS